MDQQGRQLTLLDPGLLTRGWKVLTAATVLGLVSGAIILLTITPRQEVSAKLLIEQRNSAADGRPTAARDKEFLPTQAEILSSPAVISGAMQILAPDDPSAGSPASTGTVARQLKVDPLAGTNVLLLRYSDETASRAVAVVDALIDSYRDYLRQADQQGLQRTQATLAAQETRLQQELSRLHDDYERLAGESADTAAGTPDASGRILGEIQNSLAQVSKRRLVLEHVAEQIRTLTGELNAAKSSEEPGDSAAMRTQEASGREDALLLAILSTLRELNPDPRKGDLTFNDLEAEFVTARRKVDELTTVLGERHPERIAAQVALAACRERIRVSVATAPEEIRRQFRILDAEETSLQQRHDAQRTGIRDAESVRLKQDRMLKEIERVQQASRELQVRLQDLMVPGGLTELSGSIAVTVLEPPVASSRSFAASPPIVIGICGLLGLLAGLVVLNSLTILRSARTRTPSLPAGQATIVNPRESLV